MQCKVSQTSIRLEKGALVYFFEPRIVAVIGPMKDGVLGGYAVIKNLLEAGFRGKLYPIDPSSTEILGLNVYTSIKNVPGKIDLVLIIIDCRTVPTVMMECAEKEVKAVIIFSGGFAQSMSSTGHCYDNALMESFLHTLKTELIYFEKYQTRQEARGSIFEYIEIFYNHVRKHSALNYCSPAEFEKRTSEA
jgi:predicted CoA-binding protein